MNITIRVNGFLKMKKPNKVELFIPKTPVSTQHAYVNRAVSRGKMIRFLSKDAKEYKLLVQSIFNSKYNKYITDNDTFYGGIDLQVTVFLDFKTRRRADWDNYHKLWCDALEGLVYDDDSQIKYAVVIKRHIPENPGLRLIIEPFIKE